MTVRIDRKIYSDSCISKSVYALADRYTILRSVDEQNEVLDVQTIGHRGGNKGY